MPQSVSDLPEFLQVLYRENIKSQGRTDINMVSSIRWESTPQGDKFWRDIRDDVEGWLERCEEKCGIINKEMSYEIY